MPPAARHLCFFFRASTAGRAAPGLLLMPLTCPQCQPASNSSQTATLHWHHDLLNAGACTLRSAEIRQCRMCAGAAFWAYSCKAAAGHIMQPHMHSLEADGADILQYFKRKGSIWSSRERASRARQPRQPPRTGIHVFYMNFSQGAHPGYHLDSLEAHAAGNMLEIFQMNGQLHVSSRQGEPAGMPPTLPSTCVQSFSCMCFCQGPSLLLLTCPQCQQDRQTATRPKLVSKITPHSCPHAVPAPPELCAGRWRRSLPLGPIYLQQHPRGCQQCS